MFYMKNERQELLSVVMEIFWQATRHPYLGDGLGDFSVLSMQKVTQKYVFIFVQFRSGLRNLGKLARIGSGSHDKIAAAYVVRRVTPFWLFLKSQRTF